ncbi:glycine--tRNA ligase subunit beta [Fructilactobacillus sanfranciscensis]|uniref:Glycine--tRNA ligase beta subunit n=1 Tax=Fructilactobacillus sanfranciscensis (strain TMW 1.1304) TaxID=714313 RepID=G2KU78_FRUST|nr:glycine--tRNA ligase subunit beta [Fructilactobacillus sanfranciscensis]AEN99187.1 Glycyl-tRNA synthetase beta subunit [Fructilactobacillus sanfranciscensis TMW 1.1304]MDN4461818.1 glycine--tRNA ligase subunit beta [Fructilactobacillus sanfranciscensis]NDR59876.1 glycine--tRNA ligase subunit beta [Fructilactobacillus sanfranciscensis]NDR61201.1 glycine--tRNA ligase subunit beta [Fructilactobacillus sanfranciscensis]NDR75800.1 glycine--tRNA ligase subunit beta [Fructilactobacillus sanfrancis
MTHTFLLEIGLEEMPAHVVTPSINELAEKTEKYLKENRISFDKVQKFSTPRRLALEISGLADKQPDIDEEVKGPAEKIAKDAEGNWSKAAIGFTRGQGLTPDDITFKDIKGTNYVFVNKHVTGKPVTDVLSSLIDVVADMNFPTMMKWGTNKFQFIRPIKWIVALLDTEVVPMELVGVKSGRKSLGHRFLGNEVSIANAADYETDLNKEFVIVDADKRKAKIKAQIEAIANENNWKVKIDDDLLEEVNNLVEYPTSFYGTFDKRFLDIPREVLITSMRNHQRFFYVENQDGKLLPFFISVRNGNSDFIENVIKGNEKVLAARLYDAEFFYQEDQNHDIDYFVNKLKNVTFHDKISTVYEKMQRVQVISRLIGKKVGLNDSQLADLQRAAEIYKFDLVTGMVGEFSELQGVMGEKYALLFGEKPEVAVAIREHYMPISANGELPQSRIGAVLAVADKLDTVMTFFAAGMIPSGSNDPYALRRQAAGIVNIVDNQKWRLPLDSLMEKIITDENTAQVAPKVDQKPIIKDVILFIKERIKRVLRAAKIKFDLVDAAVNATSTDILYNINSAKVLNNHKEDADFKAVIEALTRVERISNKSDFKATDLFVDPALFENESELKMNAEVDRLSTDFEKLTAADDFSKLASLEPVIKEYFDKTMVMAKDETVKENRLKELTKLARMINYFAEVDKIIVK